MFLCLNVLDVVFVTNWLNLKRNFLSIALAIDVLYLTACLLTSVVLRFHMIEVENVCNIRQRKDTAEVMEYMNTCMDGYSGRHQATCGLLRIFIVLELFGQHE